MGGWGKCPCCKKKKELTEHHVKEEDNRKMMMCDGCHKIVTEYLKTLEEFREGST